MPTVLVINNWRVAIYLNDHPPPHVHVKGPGWTVEVWLAPTSLKEVHDCSVRQARKVVDAVASHQHMLMRQWRAIHG